MGARRRLVGGVAVVVFGCVVAVAVLLSADDGRRQDTTEVLSFDAHRDWLVRALNAGEPPSDDDVESRFADAFLAERSPELLRDTFVLEGRFGDGWSVLRELDRNDKVLATQLVAEGGEQTQLTFAVDDDGRIEGLGPLVRALPCDATRPAEVSVVPQLQSRLRWYLGIVNGDARVSRQALVDAFTPELLEAVMPEDEFRSGLARIRAGNAVPFRVRYYEGEPSDFSLTARIGLNDYREGALKLVIEQQHPWRIAHASVAARSPCILPGD